MAPLTALADVLYREEAARARALVMLRRFALLGFCLAAMAAPVAQAPPVDGVVYLDANGNGRRDPGEFGMAGVAVSNQREVALTGIDGAFHLALPGTGVVFVSVPGGHRATHAFWASAGRGLSFGLARAPTPPTFSFLHGSDPHTSAESVARLRAVRAIAESRRPDFVLMTGDLVKDALRVSEAEATGYYALYQAGIAQFPMPVWSVPGNHENFGIERHLSLVSARHPLYGKGMYRARLGPNYYSFTRRTLTKTSGTGSVARSWKRVSRTTPTIVSQGFT